MNDGRAIVLDLETTAYKWGGKKSNPSPFIRENFVVRSGVLSEGEVAIGVETPNAFGMSANDVALIIGHNLCFDLHWCYRYDPAMPAYLASQGVAIWDTMLVEHILRAQQSGGLKLDELCQRYGLPLKDDRVKKMWDAGMDTDEIPVEILDEYLTGDLTNTWAIYQKQVNEAMERNMMPLIVSQMTALQATIEMTWNGLHVDREELDRQHATLTARKEPILAKIKEIVLEDVNWPDFNPGSPQQLRTYLVGGSRTVVERQQVGLFKNGNPRFKNVDVAVPVRGCGAAQSRTTDEASLQAMMVEDELDAAGMEVVQLLLEYRSLNKQLSTYIEPAIELNINGVIHHTLNHCVAVTGRLSSSKPNLQNVTNGEVDEEAGGIKRAYVSRFGDEGYIAEIDFAQLEMIALAFLSGDKALADDINHGRDMHRELYKDMHGRYPTKDERKKFKRLSFGLVYGAGAAKIAINGGITKEEAKRFISTFYARYPEVQTWHEQMYALVDQEGSYSGVKANGMPVRTYTYQTETGRCYYWQEEQAPEWLIRQSKGRVQHSFSPTQIKNYPVQGLATADIVPLAFGTLWKTLHSYELEAQSWFLINTVHDSIMLDVHRDSLKSVLEISRATLRAMPMHIEQTFGFKFPLPLEVGVSYGPNWLDQEDCEFNPNGSLIERKVA